MSRDTNPIEKDRVARSFLRGMPTYEEQAVVQRLVNEQLIGLLESLGRNRYTRILEVGSCTGMFSRLLYLVASSSTFQWLEDLSRFFAKVYRALAEGGVFAFSMFGEETYYEITELTGVGLRYPPFALVRDQVAENFKILHADIDRDHLHFDHPREVLGHIRATGVGGVGGFNWTPRRYERFVGDYLDRFSTEQGVMLSYVSYLFIAQKRGA
ncbi:MAG: hypothetical protein P8X86_16715 [Desulfofustis sp.]